MVVLYSLFFACAFLLCSGCAATYVALKKAALSPGTFVPLAAAGVVQCADADDDISDWASSRTPVFGSTENAEKWSELTLGGTHMANFAALLTASERSTVAGKAKRFAVGLAATELTYAVTGSMKTGSRRRRPDGSDLSSFPSGHASNAGVQAALAVQNLKSVTVPYGGAPFLRAGIASLSAVTGWARVEAKKHYPTDVLVGAAMGNFIGVFAGEALLDLPCAIRVRSGPERFAVQVRTEFE